MAHFLVNYLPICTFMGFRINIENQLNTCNRIFGLIFMALKTNSIQIVQCRSKFYNNFECLDICLILKIHYVECFLYLNYLDLPIIVCNILPSEIR